MKTVFLATLLAVLALSAHGRSTSPLRTLSHLTAADSETNTTSSLDYGTALKLFLDAFKKTMTCGFPAWDIPVLAPFTLKELELDFGNEYYSLNGVISNIVATGINDYRFIEYNFDAATTNVSFDVIFPQLQFLSEYNLQVGIDIVGYPHRFSGNGLFNIKLKDLRAVGNFALGPNPLNPDGIVVTDFNLNFHLGDAVFDNWNNLWDIAGNNFANKFQSELVLMWSQEIQSKVTPIYSTVVLPLFDTLLENVSMPELINAFEGWTSELNQAQCTLA